MTIEFGGMGSLVSGGPARDLLIEATGRTPVWIPLLRGYSCQEHTAGKVAGLAERRGYGVEFVRPRTQRKTHLLEILMGATVPEPRNRR